MAWKTVSEEIDQQVIAFLRSWYAQRSWGPSNREIQHAIGRGSSVVCDALDRLKDRGVIDYVPFRARSIYLKRPAVFFCIPVKIDRGDVVLDITQASVLEAAL